MENTNTVSTPVQTPKTKTPAASSVALAEDKTAEQLKPQAQAAPKTLGNSDISGAKANVPDIKVVGNGDMFQLLCKASSQNEGWMKSTKALEMDAGCLVQVTTQQRNPDGSYAVAEALVFVPCVRIVPDANGGRKLVKV